MGRAMVAVVGAILILAAAGCRNNTTTSPSTEPAAPPEILAPDNLPKVEAGPAWFADKTAASGVDFTYRNGDEAGQYTILESLGGGVALLDFDGDGYLDLFLVGGGYFDGPERNQLRGHPCKLYRNLGNWRFQDVSAEVGLGRVNWWYTHGAAVSDYDRDGWPDLLLTGFGKIALFHNESDGKGGRKFTDVGEKLGLTDDSWSTSAGWADIDGDGFPDLYVCHYCDWSLSNNPRCFAAGAKDRRDICPPQWFKPLLHRVFKNEKGQGFRDVSAEVGATLRGRGLGVVFADLNEDGRPDAYIANDMDFNFLYMNRGGKFEEKGLAAGVAANERGVPDGSMGVDVGDYDGTGRPSLFVTNFQNEWHGLYRNMGKEIFNYQSRSAGIAAIGQSYVGFGTAFIDIDNDGWEDLVVVNGHAMRNPVLSSNYTQKPVLFRNMEHQGSRFYAMATDRGGDYFKVPTLGRGLAVGDLDNDGWPDLIVSHTNSPVTLLRNVAGESAPGSWVGVKLVGKDGRDVVGSTVVLDTGARKLTRFAKGGGSYLSANDSRILFGLGGEKVLRLTVRWAWGETQTWDGLQPGAYWELREGDKLAKRLGAK